MSHPIYIANRFLRPVFCFVLLVLCPSLDGLLAQKHQLPVDPKLAKLSEPMKVSLGAKIMSSSFKIKIGQYTMARTKIKKAYSGDKKIMGLPLENNFNYSFSTHLSSKKKDTTYIDVAKSIEKEEIHELILYKHFVVRDYELIKDSYDASVFLQTNLDKNDQWLLLLSKTGAYEFSAEQTLLTNGKDHIIVKAIASEPFGSIMQTPARGLALYLNEEAIAALQYESGGGFGYKQRVWISTELNTHQKLIILASFASILELIEGGRVFHFVD